jgi:hypothetical protein
MAFTSDSFSQNTGDEATWEVILTTGIMPGQSPIDTTGDRVKIEITSATTMLTDPDGGGPAAPAVYDLLIGTVYNNSAANRTWEIYQVDGVVAAYNGRIGMVTSLMMGAMFVPHNETAVKAAMGGLAALMGHNYNWTSGPNGYDGLSESWTGSYTGDLGEIKIVTKFAKSGLVQYQKMYNGTGSGWGLLHHMELMAGAGIPGFPMVLGVLILGIFIIIYTLNSKKSPKVIL